MEKEPDAPKEKPVFKYVAPGMDLGDDSESETSDEEKEETGTSGQSEEDDQSEDEDGWESENSYEK